MKVDGAVQLMQTALEVLVRLFFFNVLIFKPLPSSTTHPPLPFIATCQPAQAEVKKVLKNK